MSRFFTDKRVAFGMVSVVIFGFCAAGLVLYLKKQPNLDNIRANAAITLRNQLALDFTTGLFLLAKSISFRLVEKNMQAMLL
jgi:hypothetical protein